MAQKNLIAWDVSAEDYPADGSLDEKIKFLLKYAILAPSGPNTQPWKYRIQDGQVALMADFSRALPDVEPSNRTMYMSLGCALTNLLIAGEHFEMGYRVKHFPDGVEGEKIAEISFQEGGRMRQFPDLFDFITERHTNRGVYDDRPIEAEKIQTLKEAVDGGVFRLDVLTDPEGRAQMAEILGQSHRIQLGNKAFRKDLARWIRPNTADAWDGLPGYAFGYSDFESYLGQFIFGTFDTSTSRARKEMGLMKASPAVGVMSSQKEDKMTWVQAGMEFEKLFLTATRLGVRFDLFSQPVAIEELRREMAQALNVKYPQILIRMGYAPPAKHTPRRLVDMVLVE
ncbi:MAG: hypothetical protein GKC10_07945 [Methanosarcinales archaeon]|nr:hypothetical protein [Methanosarcinales archaeon]